MYYEINKLLQEKKNQARLNQASFCEGVGRYEDAAKLCWEAAEICEFYKKYDKAKQMRDKARQLRAKEKGIVVKKTVVDLNKLIQQIKDGGIVVVYRCPHCGGKLKVGKGTSVESLKVCEHCGSEIEVMELADFLRTALS